ncbi:hypothetical protein Pan241w_03620 [Gimesia alba]|uniref:Uncharacterized protein n=1 Tax=Gimesia alba TaxID=2527973 RepID=A0A517R8T4_9PLAN|nr:hypothetical protein Pan241w_03620 [Gimesia alba]
MPEFELIPRRSFSANHGSKIWKTPNLWARRTIESVVPEVTKPILHHSVINRMNQEEGTYHPQNLPHEFDIES